MVVDAPPDNMAAVKLAVEVVDVALTRLTVTDETVPPVVLHANR